MTSEQLDNARLIANFLEGENAIIKQYLDGEEWTGPQAFKYTESIINSSFPLPYIQINRTQFHFRIEWILPVILKIENEGFYHNTMKSKKGGLQLAWFENHKGEIISRGIGENKPEAAYFSVVEFIKWFNAQNDDDDTSTE